MQNVYISVNPFEKKINLLISPMEKELSSISIYPIKSNFGWYNGYCKYDEILTSAITDTLIKNNVPETNVYLSLPSRDICFDYISIPNTGSAANNDSHFYNELKIMYPDRNADDMDIILTKNSKTSVVYRYAMFGQENYRKIKDFFKNTNHNLSFITSNILAEASLITSFDSIGKRLFSKDRTYEYVNIHQSYSEIALISNGEIFAVNTIPQGTNALREFSQDDFTNSRLFDRIDSTFGIFLHYYNAYRLRIAELGMPLAKRVSFLVPKNYTQIGEYLSYRSDSTWSLLELDEQYKPFTSDLGLIALYLDKVKKFNFIPSDKNQGSK